MSHQGTRLRGPAAIVLAAWCGALTAGCAKGYVTPGAAVNLQAISDYSIREKFATRPASAFPARIAVVRVQGAGYYSYTAQGHGRGSFSVVTARDVEEDEHFDKLASLPRVAGLAAVNRLLLPDELHGVKDLRTACAGLHADMLLVYTFDTAFRVKDHDLGPLTIITLGFLPNKRAYVTTTASAVLYDVRTGHIYGLAEATCRTSHLAGTWSRQKVIDNARLDTERGAFAKLIDEFAATWAAVLKEYAPKTASSS